VNPGSHRLAAHAAGRAPYGLDLVLAEGGHQTVAILLDEMSRPAPAQDTPKPGAARHPISAPTVTLFIGGGVAIVVGAVTGIAAMNHKSSLDAACKPGCPSQMSDELSAFRRDRALSYVGFGLGLAAAGAGTYLLLHESASGSEVGALVLPGGAALTGTF
jgi:hypothetical protein